MKEWERQEKRIARLRGGTRNAGSGSGWRRRNDVTEGEFLWEMKQTEGKSISIKRSDWLNVRTNAISAGRTPLMHLAIGKLNLVVMSEDDFNERFPTTGGHFDGYTD